MSVSKIISSWKQKSEIDYFSLFVPLWLAFDAWFKDKYDLSTDRKCLESLKNDTLKNKTYQKLRTLLRGNDSISETFRDYLVQLDESLKSSPIKYKKDSLKIISFSNGLVTRDADNPANFVYEDLTRKKGQHDKIKLTSDKFITDEVPKIYRAYIEILYQVRCKLIHGDLQPNKENGRIIKYLYLTLKDLISEI